MSKPFNFKHFSIIQSANPQKVGTDSMLLGAWTAKSIQAAEVRRVLDIGTGTGILALMMAQAFTKCTVTAIEPSSNSFDEAVVNFKSSDFNHQIMAINTRLQDFGALEKFDLIICNPPYFDGSYLSEDSERNNARHDSDLTAHELYEHAASLLADDGYLNIVIPVQEVTSHLERAFDNDIFLHSILFSTREDGERKRAFLSFGHKEVDPTETELLVKDANGRYSEEYIRLTRDFYGVDLSTH